MDFTRSQGILNEAKILFLGGWHDDKSIFCPKQRFRVFSVVWGRGPLAWSDDDITHRWNTALLNWWDLNQVQVESHRSLAEKDYLLVLSLNMVTNVLRTITGYPGAPDRRNVRWQNLIFVPFLVLSFSPARCHGLRVNLLYIGMGKIIIWLVVGVAM